MSGRGGRSSKGGRGSTGRGGRGRGRGQNYSGSTTSAKKGLCTTLGANVFDYGQKNAADQMRTSWEKLVHYVGTTYGQDISNELLNKLTVVLEEPVHTDVVMARHATREVLVRTAQRNILAARRAQETILQAAIVTGGVANEEAPMKLALLQNEIARDEYQANNQVEIEMDDSEKTIYTNEWRTYRERKSSLLKHRGQTFSLILGQCTQMLQDKMKQDADWITTST